MGIDFKEASVNNIDRKKFEEGYAQIWGKKKEPPKDELDKQTESDNIPDHLLDKSKSK